MMERERAHVLAEGEVKSIDGPNPLLDLVQGQGPAFFILEKNSQILKSFLQSKKSQRVFIGENQ